MAAPQILIAGIGNIFLGDDGFGVAVAQRLASRPLPAGVRAMDFGIRAFDLACALAGCDAAILIDAMPRGGAPGTLYVLEPLLDAPQDGTSARAPLDAHALTPELVLRGLPRSACPRTLRLVGCEPLRCEVDYPEEPSESQDELCMLSPPVRSAVEAAVRLVESLAAELLATAQGVANA